MSARRSLVGSRSVGGLRPVALVFLLLSSDCVAEDVTCEFGECLDREVKHNALETAYEPLAPAASAHYSPE